MPKAPLESRDRASPWPLDEPRQRPGRDCSSLGGADSATDARRSHSACVAAKRHRSLPFRTG
jgi:hypothetical protein